MNTQRFYPNKAWIQWTTDLELYQWLATFAKTLYTDRTAIIRHFILELKENDPSATSKLSQFIELGIREPVITKTVAKVGIPEDLAVWLRRSIRQMPRHPEHPNVPLRPGFLLNGYFRYLHDHQTQCVQHGKIQLDAEP